MKPMCRYHLGSTLYHFSIDVTVTVHLSPTFYAWLFQYAGKMTIVEPEGIREAYAERLQTAIDDVLSN